MHPYSRIRSSLLLSPNEFLFSLYSSFVSLSAASPLFIPHSRIRGSCTIKKLKGRHRNGRYMSQLKNIDIHITQR